MLFLQHYFTTIFYNIMLQLFFTTLIRYLNSLNNITINIIITINSDLSPHLLSNQIRCWEGGMGEGYPLPDHLIWLDNKSNIYSN